MLFWKQRGFLGSMTQPDPTACSIQKKIARTLDICYAKLMVSQIHTKRNLLTKCYESLVVSRFDGSDVPLRDEERWWGARSDFIRVGMAYHVKHCSMFVISMISIFWMVNVCWIITKQKLDCLLGLIYRSAIRDIKGFCFIQSFITSQRHGDFSSKICPWIGRSWIRLFPGLPLI